MTRQKWPYSHRKATRLLSRLFTLRMIQTTLPDSDCWKKPQMPESLAIANPTRKRFELKAMRITFSCNVYRQFRCDLAGWSAISNRTSLKLLRFENLRLRCCDVGILGRSRCRRRSWHLQLQLTMACCCARTLVSSCLHGGENSECACHP